MTVAAQLDKSLWTARDDSAERGDTRRLAHIVEAAAGQAPAAGEPVLLGFACDAGVARNQGRIGAAAGPAGIRKYMAGLPAHGLTRLLDAGDVACEGAVSYTHLNPGSTPPPTAAVGGWRCCIRRTR